MSPFILISGGAGYIGSHAAYALAQAGYEVVVIDNLSKGNAWATDFGAFEKGDVGDPDFVRSVCEKYKPVAAMHFAAFIDVAESVRNPNIYFDNNRDKAARFFKTLNACGVQKCVFSSTAAVYGEHQAMEPISEMQATRPINPYGQSKLDAEAYLRMLDVAGMRSVALRYFNVAGAAPPTAHIGEAHYPETHLFPRLIMPLIDTPDDILQGLDLGNGFTIFGSDYDTPDGTAVRDYLHVLDLADAHLRALDYLLQGGETTIFNLGSGTGYSVLDIVKTTAKILNRSNFAPKLAPRREGDPAILIASNEKAREILDWKPTRRLTAIIGDTLIWLRSPRYRDTMREKIATHSTPQAQAV